MRIKISRREAFAAAAGAAVAMRKRAAAPEQPNILWLVKLQALNALTNLGALALTIYTFIWSRLESGGCLQR